MAEADFTQSNINTPKYQELPIDKLNTKALQLASMITIIRGEGFKTFSNWNDTIKENYLWACSDLADEIVILSEQI
jgi:hypothetical protein